MIKENNLNINNNTTVVILAAGKINHRLNILMSESSCPALLPLNNRPLASYSLDFYINNGIYPYLIIDEDCLSDVLKELIYLEGKVKIIPLKKTSGVLDTLKKSISLIPKNENIIINLVTSIPTKVPLTNHIQIDEKLTENFNWSCISFHENSTAEFHSKSSLIKKSGYAFTGIFNVKYDSFIKALTTKLNNNEDLLSLIENLSKITKLSYNTQEWLDCGHKINYLETKPKLISSRSFNAVEIDEIGIIKKSSKNIIKLENEFNYISMLPTEISYFFPRVFDFNNQIGSASYRMEYYGYATVAELQLYWSLDKDLWSRFFEKIEIILKRFRKNRFSIGMKSFQDFYWNKLLERINDYEKFLINNHHDTSFMYEDVIINDVKCSSFFSLKNDIKIKLKKQYKEDDFCIVHGDFCFNNILYDIHSGIIRLIDPRGSFGENAKGIYGDFKYDLAKFLHSSVWNYDYLVNYQFTLEGNEKSKNYKLYFNRRKNEKVLHDFSRNLLDNLNYDYNDISFLVSLLFLSMTSLHTDSVLKSKAMYLQGIFILNKYIKKT